MSQEDVVDTGTAAQTESGRLIRWEMLITGAVMGLLVAGLAAWATANAGISRPVFVIGFLGGTYLLYQKEIPDEAIGLGLNIAAVVVFLAPILFYLSNVVAGQPDAVPGTGILIGSLLELGMWGVVFFLLAVVVGSVACYFDMEAKEKLRT
jgi:hypothetical protein